MTLPDTASGNAAGSGPVLDDRDLDDRDLDDESFVRRAYRVVLQRDADPGGIEHWTRFLADGGWRKRVVAGMVESEEFRTLGTEPLQVRLHRARQAWIRSLPTADDLIDIGGSSPTDPEGALREMGWPGKPSRLRIVDLPPEDQYHGRPSYSQEQVYVTPWGGEVQYLHSWAEDLPGSDVLAGEQVDAFFMGQAIEHVAVDAVPALLEWIREHLASDGWFAFDTPNRSVTELQTPDAYIDPDHTREYRSVELVSLLLDAGFRLTSQAGIMPYPGSVRLGAWDPEETFHLPMVTPDPTTGYCVGFVATPG